MEGPEENTGSTWTVEREDDGPTWDGTSTFGEPKFPPEIDGDPSAAVRRSPTVPKEMEGVVDVHRSSAGGGGWMTTLSCAESVYPASSTV